MTARYQTRLSEELITAWDTGLLPDGLRIVEVGPVEPPYLPYRMVTFDDDGASEELNGKTVLPLFRIQADGSVAIVGRDVEP